MSILANFSKIFLQILKHVAWLSWSVISSALNIFLAMVFGAHVLRTVISQYEARKILPLLNEKHPLHIWNYEEGREFLNVLLIIFWQKSSNILVSIKTNFRSNIERPKAVDLFGLCSVYMTILFTISLICAINCDEQHCLYLIGW